MKTTSRKKIKILMFVDYLKAWGDYKNDPNLLSLRTLKTLKKEIQRDLLEAFELGRSAIDEHPDLYDNSSSFVDFLFKLTDVFTSTPKHSTVRDRSSVAAVDSNDNELKKIQQNQTYVQHFLHDLNKGVNKLLISANETFKANENFFVQEQNRLQNSLEHLNSIITQFNESYQSFQNFLSHQKQSRPCPSVPGLPYYETPLQPLQGLFETTRIPLPTSSLPGVFEADTRQDHAENRNNFEVHPLEESWKIEKDQLTTEINTLKMKNLHLKVEKAKLENLLQSTLQTLEESNIESVQNGTFQAPPSDNNKEIDVGENEKDTEINNLKQKNEQLKSLLERFKTSFSLHSQTMETDKEFLHFQQQHITHEKNAFQTLYENCQENLTKCQQREQNMYKQMREIEMENSSFKREIERLKSTDAQHPIQNEVIEKQIRDLETKLKNVEREKLRLADDLQNLEEKFEQKNTIIEIWRKNIESSIPFMSKATIMITTATKRGRSRERKRNRERSRSRSPIQTNTEDHNNSFDLENWFQSLLDALLQLYNENNEIFRIFNIIQETQMDLRDDVLKKLKSEFQTKMEHEISPENDRGRQHTHHVKEYLNNMLKIITAFLKMNTEFENMTTQYNYYENVLQKLYFKFHHDKSKHTAQENKDEKNTSDSAVTVLYDSKEDDSALSTWLDSMRVTFSDQENEYQELLHWTKLLYSSQEQKRIEKRIKQLQTESLQSVENDPFHYKQIFIHFYEISKDVLKSNKEYQLQTEEFKTFLKKHVRLSKGDITDKMTLVFIKNMQEGQKLNTVMSRNKKLLKSIHLKDINIQKLKTKLLHHVKIHTDLGKKLNMPKGSLQNWTKTIMKQQDDIKKLMDFFQQNENFGIADSEESKSTKLELSHIQEKLQKHFTNINQEKQKCIQKIEDVKNYIKQYIRKILSFQINLPLLSKEEMCMFCGKKINIGERPNRFDCDEHHLFHEPCLATFIENTNLPILCLRDQKELFPNMTYMQKLDTVTSQPRKRPRSNSQ